MKDMIAYAQGRLREAEQSGTDMDMRYWAAYLDGVRATVMEITAQLTASEAARADLGKRLAKAEQELAQVKAERSWISVKDRLPERTIPPHDVLVYHDLNCGMYIDRAWYSHDKNKWRNVLSMNLKATHWMPLPEPPEKAEAALKGDANETDSV